jgi:hypothetical protein
MTIFNKKKKNNTTKNARKQANNTNFLKFKKEIVSPRGSNSFYTNERFSFFPFQCVA